MPFQQIFYYVSCPSDFGTWEALWTSLRVQQWIFPIDLQARTKVHRKGRKFSSSILGLCRQPVCAACPPYIKAWLKCFIYKFGLWLEFRQTLIYVSRKCFSRKESYFHPFSIGKPAVTAFFFLTWIKSFPLKFLKCRLVPHYWAILIWCHENHCFLLPWEKSNNQNFKSWHEIKWLVWASDSDANRGWGFQSQLLHAPPFFIIWASCRP